MPQYFLEDLHPSLLLRSTEMPIDASAIADFDRRFPVAQPELMRSFFVTGATMRLLVRDGLPISGGVIGAGIEQLSWPHPIAAGDVLRVESEVLEVQQSRRRPDVGRARIRSRTLNQRDEVVQEFTAQLMVPRRTPATA
jgi:acyl dehydratase